MWELKTNHVIRHKLAWHLVSEKTVNIGGKEYTVELYPAMINEDLYPEFRVFIKGKTVYLIPEFRDRTITYYLAYEITKEEWFKHYLPKRKVNPNKILKHATVIREYNNIKLIKAKGVTMILKDKNIYFDPIQEQSIEAFLKSL